MKERTNELGRREVLGALTVGAALLATRGGVAMAEEKDAAAAAGIATGKHAPVKLPFDAKKLPGLSERLLVSHHDNNYAGAVLSART